MLNEMKLKKSASRPFSSTSRDVAARMRTRPPEGRPQRSAGGGMLAKIGGGCLKWGFEVVFYCGSEVAQRLELELNRLKS